jgi:hypothetical protein
MNTHLFALVLVLAATPVFADSEDLINGLRKSGIHATLAEGSAASTQSDDDFIKSLVASNKALLTKLQGGVRELLSLFGTNQAAIDESLQYPSVQDGNGHDCAVLTGQFTQVIHDHPLALTGNFFNDLENQRVLFASAEKVCNAPSCQAVFGELSAQVSKIVSGINGKVGAATSLIPGVGTVAGVVSAAGSTVASANVFTMACGDLANVALVPPQITPSPTPTAGATPTPAATNTGIVPPALASPTPTPSPSGN